MSGPVSTDDAPPAASGDTPATCDVEVIAGRAVDVGGFPVRRVLPRRPRRTIGAWCFADHMGPVPMAQAGPGIGPHPHIGLQTVTWLLAGEMLHRDSLGSEQLVRPGQLNLMTAGHGVAHSEEVMSSAGQLHGVQLWVAQPAATRDGPPAFEHHGELPRCQLGRSAATLLVGQFAGLTSTARRDTEHVGVDLELRPGRTTLPLFNRFEYALVVLDGAVSAAGCPLQAGSLGYLGLGRDEVLLEAAAPARALLLGGEPFPEPLLMWWNYVARERGEVVAAHRDWQAGTERFGTVASSLTRIDTAGPPWAG